jgi:uncharacterized RDD family membrane protein YckC
MAGGSSRSPGVLVEAAIHRRARMSAERHAAKRIRTLTTPEGATLRLRLASATERAGAFLIDIAIQWAVVIITALGVSSLIQAFNPGSANLAFSLWLIFFFFFRNFYFIFFEIGQRAATPGKRMLGLRVASRNGGRLTANSVLARNFMREIEVGLPLQFLLMATSQTSAWIPLLGLVWSGIFLLLPVFNRDKLRAGDLIAGTWIIHSPKAKLLPDIASAATSGEAGRRYAFSTAQTEAYGIHELHVLEDVLRQSTPEVKGQVAERIRAKIGWPSSHGESDLAFLEAYYAALRRRLEQKMLFGRRKADKYDTN